MAKTVVGLFDELDDAQEAVRDLTEHGFDRSAISLVAADSNTGDAERGTTMRSSTSDDADDAASGAAKGAGTGALLGGAAGLLLGLGALAIPGVGPIIAGGPLVAALTGAGIGAATGGLIGALTNAGVPEEEATYYAEGVRRGGTLVTVTTDDDMADKAASIMEDHDAVDIDQRVSEWRQSGWSGSTSETNVSGSRPDNFYTSETSKTQNTVPTGTNDQVRIPVVEEELRVGKREVQSGGVRVNKRVTERPVEEEVSLRQEHVEVERRAVDRPLTEADANAFQEQTFELTERAEEAVVDKQARVIEEVILNKNVEQRTERIEDTVRRSDVQVEELPAGQTFATRNLDNFDNDFRTNYRSTLAESGYSYDQAAPAYKFGASLASDSRYGRADWSSVESDARQQWESRNQGTWDDFKDAVHYAWDRARNI